MRARPKAPCGVAERSSQFLAQLQPRAVQPHFDISFGQAEFFGGFLDGKSLHIAQQKHQTRGTSWQKVNRPTRSGPSNSDVLPQIACFNTPG